MSHGIKIMTDNDRNLLRGVDTTNDSNQSSADRGIVWDRLSAIEILNNVETLCENGAESYTLRQGGYLKTFSTWMFKVDVPEFRNFLLQEYEEDLNEETDLRLVIDERLKEVRVYVTDETVEDWL